MQIDSKAWTAVFHATLNQTLFQKVSNIGSEYYIHSSNPSISVYHLNSFSPSLNQRLEDHTHAVVE